MQRDKAFVQILTMRNNQAIIPEVFNFFLTEEFLSNSPRETALLLIEKFWECAFTASRLTPDKKPYYSYRISKILDEKIYGPWTIRAGTAQYRTDFIQNFENLSKEIMERSPVDLRTYIRARVRESGSDMDSHLPKEKQSGLGRILRYLNFGVARSNMD
jgi:hypothetical protein